MSPAALVSAWEITGYTKHGEVIDHERYDGPAHLWTAGGDNSAAATAVVLAFTRTKTLADFLASHDLADHVSLCVGVRPHGLPDEPPQRCRVDAHLAVQVHVHPEPLPARLHP